jgi:hypothetical protein
VQPADSGGQHFLAIRFFSHARATALPMRVSGDMPPYDLVERTRLFALSVASFCRSAPHTDEAREAARRGRSRAEFEAKLGTVFEEADECVDWLEYFRDNRMKADEALITEARELAMIFAKARKTAFSTFA